MTDVDDGIDPVETGERLSEWTAEERDVLTVEQRDVLADTQFEPGRATPVTEGGNRVWRAITSNRGARLTSWIVLIALWQLSGRASERFPTPVGTYQHFILEFHTQFHSDPWTIWRNQLVSSIAISLYRWGLGTALVILIGVPVGWAMGRWWRAQAYASDGVTIGLALPAYIWALLAIMVFGFGLQAPVFTVVVSATPILIVHVLQGTFAIPRELRDMTRTYDVPFMRQVWNLTLPSMAGQLVAGVRLAVLAGWGCVVLVEWFGSNGGVGFEAREWYLSSNFNALMAWALVITVVVIFIDRVIIEHIDRRVHRWRGAVGGFGGGSRATRKKASNGG